MPAITCDRGARGGRRALDDGVSELWCVPWWRARGDRVRAKHGHGPFCDDAPLCGDRLLRALCALRDGDGLQPRGAWPHGDGDRAWTWGVLQLNSATLLRSNHECQI